MIGSDKSSSGERCETKINTLLANWSSNLLINLGSKHRISKGVGQGTKGILDSSSGHENSFWTREHDESN